MNKKLTNKQYKLLLYLSVEEIIRLKKVITKMENNSENQLEKSLPKQRL